MCIINKAKHFVVYIVMIGSPAIAVAHDTTHIHPLITDKIADLIKITDSAQSYQNLYIENNDDIRIYWGIDFDSSVQAPTLDQPYLLSDNLPPYGIFVGKIGGYDNVIDGVVAEDVPSANVKDHFYHAKQGIGLTHPQISPTKPSPEIAMKFFNNAVDRMSGYHDESIKTAFFEFGQALHHVEDMSSPAHVHNDPHLTLNILGIYIDSERDDYEGWYLPQMKQDQYFGARLEGSPTGININLFSNAVTVKPVNNPWTDIWGTSNPNSMVNYFYDRTTFTGSLQFPVDTIDQIELDISGNIEVTAAAIPPPSASGELKEMFPCPGGDLNHPNCLHWEEEDMMDLAHWKINAIGAFRHQYSPDLNQNEWWAIEIETDPDSGNVINNVPAYAGVFYIEQLAQDNSNSNPLGTPIVPENIRSNFNSPWASGTNDMTANTKQLLQIYAENLLGPAVEYGAGFTQYWYDIANTPPYLKEVKAYQHPNGGAAEQLVYTASWDDSVIQIDIDPYIDLEHCNLSALVCDSLERPYITVLGRSLIKDNQNISHIDDDQNLKLELTFNEPVETISQLLIDTVDMTTYAASAVKSNNDAVWTLTIPDTALAGLNGKLQLTVKATDKNNHRRGTDCSADGVPDDAGGELDGSPDTPAKRNISLAMDEDDVPNEFNCYPWYIGDGVDPNTTDDDKYSYDFTNGDQNHWLVFDTSPPSATITIDLTLD